MEENSLSVSSGCDQVDQPSSTLTTGSELLEEENAFMEFFRARETQNQIFTLRRNQRHSSEDQLLRGQLLNYNRKEKSLEELSRRFLELYVHQNESMLELDKITLKLGVERRRIYDIINILQSLKVVIRTGKNLYKWNGLQRVAKTIEEYESDATVEVPKVRKEKSLQVLSIGFLKLFIHWRRALSLEEAAKKLVGDMEPQKLKTKVRRLYDIANVFKSLGLVKKTYLPNRKPGFEWVGISGLYETFRAKTEPTSEPEPSPQIRPCSFFSEHIMSRLGGANVPSIESLMTSWNSRVWSCETLPLSKSRSMCETTATKTSNSILKQRTNERTTDTHKSAFGSFRKIELDNDMKIEPKVLFTS